MDPDGPIGVLAAGPGGRLVAGRLARLMPREDVLLMSDEGWAPWARRPGRTVAARCVALAADLAAGGAKLVVLASLQGTLDGLDEVRRTVPVQVLGFELEPLVMQAAAIARGGPLAIVVDPGSVRPAQLTAALKRVRSGGLPVLGPADPMPTSGTLALASATVSLAPERVPPGVQVVVAADLAVQRAHRALTRARLLARRKRAGRLLAMSSHPVRA
ncbi:MAG TPA: hypothetical protein VFQ71_05495 [Gaiellales bacterium]|jgi:hypothetical protein|nr:hypothetical protein [Gaiellales bacterium]